eukprot:scaffold136404_cov34-Tisochrysis_lutea.AAC.3
MREVSHTLYTYIHRTTTTDPRAENGEISTPLRKKEPSSSYFLWSRHSLPLVRNERRGSCCVLVQGRLALASAPPAPSQKGRKGLVLSHKKNQISIKSPTSPVEQHKKPRAFIQPDGTEVVVVPTTNRHRAPRVPNTSHGMAHAIGDALVPKADQSMYNAGRKGSTSAWIASQLGEGSDIGASPMHAVKERDSQEAGRPAGRAGRRRDSLQGARPVQTDCWRPQLLKRTAMAARSASLRASIGTEGTEVVGSLRRGRGGHRKHE